MVSSFGSRLAGALPTIAIAISTKEIGASDIFKEVIVFKSTAPNLICLSVPCPLIENVTVSPNLHAPETALELF